MDGRRNRRNNSAFSISSGLKNVFKKPRFRDGLVWTVRLTVEIKLHFQFFKFLLRIVNLAFEKNGIF